MSEERACLYKPTIKDKIKYFYFERRHQFSMTMHEYFWRFLHLTRLARIYSVSMCRLNLYKKFPNGSCQWCGINHG